MKASQHTTHRLHLLSEESTSLEDSSEGLEDDMEDFEMLAEDPLGNLPSPPELVDPSLLEVVTWDEAADVSGHRVLPVVYDDEIGTPELLVEEGLDEADEELRAMGEDLDSEDRNLDEE